MIVFCKEMATNITALSAEDIIMQMNRGEDMFGLWLIVAEAADKQLCALLPAREAMKPYYAERLLKIVGMAFGEMEARLLLADMLREWLARGESVFTWKRHCLGLEERA